MGYWNNNDEEIEEMEEAGFDENTDYTKWQLEYWADQLLKEDRKREICRRCDEKEELCYGEETGHIESLPMTSDDGPVTDDDGKTLYVEYPELACKRGHRWYQGEGKARGISGPNPILFENHLQDRRRREIYTSIGTPDPSIQQGIYNRSHPQGRKINSDEQRKKNGASYYR